jgi:hypothetical protein
MVALNVYDEDELPLIRLLSKVKCKFHRFFIHLAFEYEKLYEAQRQELIRRALNLLDNGEFFEILIPCLTEAIDKFGILMSKQVKENLQSRLSKVLIKSVKEIP